jgi:sterol 24-C-methyltransferase
LFTIQSQTFNNNNTFNPSLQQTFHLSLFNTMAPAKLEAEDHSRDAAFNKAMHKNSSTAQGGFRAMMGKDRAAQQAAVDEYFKHWNKDAKEETAETREVGVVSICSITC